MLLSFDAKMYSQKLYFLIMENNIYGNNLFNKKLINGTLNQKTSIRSYFNIYGTYVDKKFVINSQKKENK